MADDSRRSWGAMSHKQRYRLQHETMLRIARRLAEERGYEGTQIKQVVALAGVSRQTFYEHFASKEGCFGELVMRALGVGVKILTDAADEALHRGPFPTFLAMISAWAAMAGSSPTVPLSGPLQRSLWREAQRPESDLTEAMVQMLGVGAEVLFVAARRLGSPLPDDLLRLAAHQQLTALLGPVETPPGEVHPREQRMLATVLTVAFGFPLETKP